MLQVISAYPLPEMEAAVARAVQRHGGSVLAVTHLGQLLESERPAANDALVFTLCFQSIYRALLAADIRFAALLPCRIAAVADGDHVTVETLSPRGFCQMVNRPDLERLAAPLETLLKGLLDALTHRATAAAHPIHPPGHYTLGATEDQMNMRGSIPQRIDCKGTKVEDLAGVGKHDAAGG